MDLEQLQCGVMRRKRLDGVEDRVDGAVAGRLMRQLLSVNVERERRRLRAMCASHHHQRLDLDVIMSVDDLVVDQRDQIFVVNEFLAVGQILEAIERVQQRVLAEVIAELLQLFTKRVAARMLAHDERGLGDPDALRRHDLIGVRILEHAVLMDSALMRESVPPDDRLVVLHRKGRDRRDELRRARQQLGVDIGEERQRVGARLHRHHDFF
ncbi:MAG: Uncharacterized protein FD148_1652 [Methylocystaceae bacterium]|nr:MAG: Uncharacterized protein FD148_1652 [Methylocystaceae bacterium]